MKQKYYVELGEPNRYGGIYIWESKEALGAFLKSDLFAAVPKAYQVVGAPDVEVVDALFQLRD